MFSDLGKRKGFIRFMMFDINSSPWRRPNYDVNGSTITQINISFKSHQLIPKHHIRLGGKLCLKLNELNMELWWTYTRFRLYVYRKGLSVRILFPSLDGLYTIFIIINHPIYYLFCYLCVIYFLWKGITLRRFYNILSTLNCYNKIVTVVFTIR